LAPDSPKASPAPSDAAIWCRVRQSWRFLPVRLAKGARTSSPSPRLSCLTGAASISVGDVNPCAGVLFLCTDRTMRPRTLPVALLPPGLACWASWGKRTKDPFHGSTPMPPLSRPEAPSTDRSRLPRPLLALRTRLRTATGPDWLCRRGPASDTHSLVQVRARSHLRAGYSPELVRPRAVYRLLQCVDSRARPPTSKPHRFFIATTEAAARRVTTPEGAANQAVSAQG